MADTKPRHVKAPVSNGLYDELKFVSQIILPGLGVLYATLAELWGLPYAVQVVGTIAAVDLFTGALVKRLATLYNRSDDKFDGAVVVDHSDAETDRFVIQPFVSPSELNAKTELTLKVQDPNRL